MNKRLHLQVESMFPKEHWKRICTNSALERLNKKVNRRTNVVGIFLDEALTIRLVGAVLQEQANEWRVARRYFSLESMKRLYEPEPVVMAEPIPFTLVPVH